MTRRRLVLVGSRLQAYREYSLASLAPSFDVALVSSQPVTWERPYIVTDRVADTTSAEALLPAVEELIAEAGPRAEVGIFTWDELSLLATARVAERLRLRHMGAHAASVCRDKAATRAALDAAGLPNARHFVARSLAEALDAAEEIGFPVVLKPRSLGGSLGVTVARDRAALDSAYTVAAEMTLPGIPSDGVVVEEFLDGPELSIDSYVLDGEPQPVFVARKRVGYDPTFEEVGHLVAAWRDEPWAGELDELLRATHRAVGVDWGITHTEVRLTGAGPRLIELNGRLGGDLIPYIGQLATGVDLPLIGAQIAFGERPHVEPTFEQCAEIRFLYPAHDGVVDRIDVGEAEQVPGIAEIVRFAEAGTELLLPPKSLTPRTLGLIALCDDPAACTAALDRAEAEVRTVMRGSPLDGLGALVENPVTRRFLSGERGLERTAVDGMRDVDRAWFRYGAGGGELLNRPVLLSAEDRARLEDDLNGIFELLTEIPDRLFDGDRRAFAHAVGMSPTQTELVLRGTGGGIPPLARADMYRETTGFRLMELNTGSSLGGWQMGEFGRAMLYDAEFRAFAEAEGLVYPDPLAAIASVLLDECPGIDLASRPVLAITDWPDGFEKSKCWLDFVVPGWLRLGFDARVCHLGELEYRDGHPYVHGKRIDVVYRIFLPGEIGDDQRSYDLVAPLLAAVERGDTYLFAPLDCELYGNKGSLAMLSDERNRAALAPEERELVDRVLPWTRFVRDERVDVEGESVDLLAYVLANKHRLTLKPTILYGGLGVVTGWTTSDEVWAEQVRAAVDGPYVVQERVVPVTERFASPDGSGFEELVLAYGVMQIGSRYAGMLARGVPDPNVGIVNMPAGARIGCAFHVEDRVPAVVGAVR